HTSPPIDRCPQHSCSNRRWAVCSRGVARYGAWRWLVYSDSRPSSTMSRWIEMTVGILLGIGGLLFLVFALGIALMPAPVADSAWSKLLVAAVLLTIGLPATLYAGRLLFPRLRPSHGGVVGPLGLEVAGVCLLILPLVLLLTGQYGHPLLILTHVGASGAC